MRTTIEVTDPLLREAKKVALERNTTLRAIVESALERELNFYRGHTGRRVTEPLVHVSPVCPILQMGPADLAAADAAADVDKINGHVG